MIRLSFAAIVLFLLLSVPRAIAGLPSPGPGLIEANLLLKQPVYASAEADAIAWAEVEDAIIRDGRVVALIISKYDRRLGTTALRDVQVFQEQEMLRVVIAPDSDTLRPVPEDLPVEAMLSRRAEKYYFTRQALDIAFYGPVVEDNLLRVAAELRKRFGPFAFRTRLYRTRPNDFVCKIYQEQVGLPITLCPKSAEQLNRTLNPDVIGHNIKVDADLLIPELILIPGPGSRDDIDLRAPVFTLRLPLTRAMIGVFLGELSYLITRQISIHVTNAGEGIEKSAQSDWTGVDQSNVCDTDPTDSPSERSFYYYFDWLQQGNPPWQPSEKIKACVLGGQASRADILLIDQDLIAHDEISAIRVVDRLGNTTDLPPKSPNPVCTVSDNLNLKTEHGTHLASIIGSRADGKGFVGISPGLDILAFPWQVDSTVDGLQELFEKRTNLIPETGPTFAELGPQLFVFASHLPAPGKVQSPPYSYPEEWRDGTRLKAELKSDNTVVPAEERRTELTMQRKIYDSDKYAFWVVAAMQKSDVIPEALDIDARLAYSPVNLGDRPNVLVVTACEQCSEGKASVWKDAFYSQKFVQVAAPGLSVTAPVGPNHYATGGGTSQATAIVGGLVGAMLNCYPDYYRETAGQSELKASVLKERVQYTAKPLFYDDEDLNRLASGIVDPEVALLDPTVHWMKMKGQHEYIALDGDNELVGWCRNTIEFVDKKYRRQKKYLTNLLRAVRVSVPGGVAGNLRPWVLYLDDPTTPGKIDRFGPQSFHAAEDENSPLAKKRSGHLIYPRDVDDLVLRKNLTPVTCDVTPA